MNCGCDVFNVPCLCSSDFSFHRSIFARSPSLSLSLSASFLEASAPQRPPTRPTSDTIQNHIRSLSLLALALPLTPSLLIQEAALCGGGSAAGRAVRNWKGGRHHKPPTNKVGTKTGERERARQTNKWPFMDHVPRS